MPKPSQAVRNSTKRHFDTIGRVSPRSGQLYRFQVRDITSAHQEDVNNIVIDILSQHRYEENVIPSPSAVINRGDLSSFI